MTTRSDRSIPQPIAFDPKSPPEIPPHLRPIPPGPLRVTQVIEADRPELAIVYKRSYAFEHDQPCRLVDEQPPLDEEGELHEEIAPGVAPSAKSLPEIVGLKPGTDLVVQASARPPQPVNQMTVEVQVGAHRHGAEVCGRRFCEYVNGELRFTPPEPFEEMPLRYENAYGGRDPKAEQALLDDAKRMMHPDRLRRIGPIAAAMLEGNHPLMYPRNRFGKGYVLDARREFVEGRELPNLERADDRLTPERLVVDPPLHWAKQPLPVGFDYLDPLSFPRSAMLAMPPASGLGLEDVAEVARGLVPPDYCRGNIAAARPDQIGDLMHPAAGRCASLGLWLPPLRGDEQIALLGMDAALPRYCVALPGEVPRFEVRGISSRAEEVYGRPSLVLIDMHAKRLSLIWVGRMPLSQPLQPGQAADLTAAARVEMRRLDR